MIKFENVTFKYDKNCILFENLSFEIKKNNFCAILGRSGAGKSSILNLIAGIESIDKHANSCGKIYLRNELANDSKIFINPEKRNISMIFQTPSLFSHKNVIENIMFGMNKLTNTTKQEKLNKINSMLKKIKMEDFSKRYPHELSVGQQQRIAFARAILSGSDIILLDEPFSGLDFESKFLLYNILLEIKHKSEKTIVLVTHDFEEAAFFANQFLIINENTIHHYNSIDEIYNNPKSTYIASLFQFSNIVNNKSSAFDIHYKNCVIRPENIVRKDSGIKAIIKEIKCFGSYYILLLTIENTEQIIFMKVNKIDEDMIIGNIINVSVENALEMSYG